MLRNKVIVLVSNIINIMILTINGRYLISIGCPPIIFCCTLSATFSLICPATEPGIYTRNVRQYKTESRTSNRLKVKREIII